MEKRSDVESMQARRRVLNRPRRSTKGRPNAERQKQRAVAHAKKSNGKTGCSASKLQTRAPKKQTLKAACSDAPTQTAPCSMPRLSARPPKQRHATCKIKHPPKQRHAAMQNQAPAKNYEATRYRTRSSRLTPLRNNHWRHDSFLYGVHPQRHLIRADMKKNS